MSEKRSIGQWIVFGLEKFGEGICNLGVFFKKNWRLSFELRKVALAAPVIMLMLWLENECAQRLPDMVGINLMANGDFQQLIARQTAIGYTSAITIACLVFMFLSRKTIYPWLISLFSLVLPVLLILTNTFPA